MASCRVQRNDNGRITKVTEENGAESKLYNSIAKHPMVENEEEALRIYMNSLTDEVPDGANFTHRVNGEFEPSYKKAILKAKEGSKIEMGFLSNGEFSPIVTLSKTTDRSSKEGFLNYMIQNNYLSDSKKKTKDGYKFQSAGNTDTAKIVNAEIIRDSARAYLGTKGVGKDLNTFKLDKSNDTVDIVSSDGQTISMSKTELDNMTYSELSEITDYALDIILAREIEMNRPNYGFRQPEVKLPNRNEGELQSLLTNFLKKIGVSTTSMENYIKNYNTKNGVDPSANALADIANRVIAFHEGRMGLEALTEEVAHFINEAMPQEEVEQILANIHKADEWAEHADSYREVYSKTYEGAALEQAVRREVLGKVVANSILSEFNTEGKNATQTGFIANALDILTKFFERIQAYFKPEHKTELDKYLNSVQEILTAEELSDRLNTDNFNDNQFVLYNMSNVPKSSIKLSAEKAVIALRDQVQKSLAKAKKGSAINRQKIQSIQKKIEDNEEMGAVEDINSLAKTYIKMLNKTIDDAEKNNKPYVFSQEENIIFQALKTQIIPSLNEINSLIEEKTDNKKQWRKVQEGLNNTVQDAGKLEGRAKNIETNAINNLIDKIMVRHELPESSREYMEKWIKTAEADTNWFHANFGMLTHSRDGLLNLTGMIQKDIATQSNIKWQDSTKKYQNRLRELGISEKEISKFIDGQFIVSEYDFNRFEETMQRLEANVYKEVTKSDLSVDEIIEKKKEGEREPLNSSEELQLKRKLRNLRNGLLERKFNTEYYDKFEQNLKDLDISQVGIKFITDYYGDMSQFKRAARTVKKGKEILDYSLLSEQDKAVMEDITQARSKAKSYFNETGELRKGLEFDASGEVVESDDVALSEDAQLAIDLHKLDSTRDSSLNTENKGIPPIFLDTIREIEDTQGREAALEFLKLNSFTGFTDEYWEQMDLGSGGVMARLEELLRTSGSLQAEDVYTSLKEDRQKLKSILKIYRNKNNPSEINVNSMPLDVKSSIKTIQQRLSDSYKTASELTKNVQLEGETTDNVSSVNDSYFKHLEDLDAIIDFDVDDIPTQRAKIKEEVDFSLEHMTETNSNEVRRAMESIDLYQKSKRNTVIPLVKRKLEEQGLEEIDLWDDASAIKVRQAIVRSRVLPYFTKFAPVEYNDFNREINTSSEYLSDILPEIGNRYKYIQVSPNYSFFDDSQNDNLNPNYNEEFEGGYLQPKLNVDSTTRSNVLSGITDKKEKAKINDLISNGYSSSKFNEVFKGDTNSNLYKAYQATLDYNKESLEAMGVANTYNMYTLPQVKRKRMERFEKFTQSPSVDQLREAFSDEFTYTEDDKIQGERGTFGESVKIIPKMYVDRLQNPQDVSGELFYSLALRAKEAHLREARIEHYGDFMAIYDKILDRSYKGKDVKSTNTLKMFESAMDYSLFGIKETAMYPIKTMFGTVDVAKLARKLLGFIKFRNLGLNVVIPITSYLTGRATREIEKYVGEHMDTRSQSLGDKEFRKHAKEAIGEIGEINTKSKLSVMGQYFQAFDLDESFQNSNYGKYLRLLPRTGMMLHTGANFPIYGSTLFGVLHDFRTVNGSIMRFNQFERQELANGKDKKDIKNAWDKLESEAIYNYMEVKDSEVIFDDAAIRSKMLNSEGNKMTEAEYEVFKKEKVQAIRAHVSNVITNIDGQIPNESRVHAQRHFALNYFMTHRGWLSIVASRRFKNRHLNTETGEVEEGSYRTLWDFMGKYLKEFKKGNFTSFVQNWKNVYDNVSPEESQLVRRNMKRIGIEMAALNGLMLIGFLLNGLADDDEWEDSYGVQGISYLFNRTLNEMSSAQLGSVNNFSEVIESPFVGWSTVKTFTDAGDLFSGDEVIYGSYRGLSERQRFLTKLVPGAKQVYDLSSAKNVKNMRNTYMFYNNANFNYSPLGNLYWLSENK